MAQKIKNPAIARFMQGMNVELRSAIIDGPDTIRETRNDKPTLAAFKAIENAGRTTLQNRIDDAIESFAKPVTDFDKVKMAAGLYPETLAESELFYPDLELDDSQEEALDTLTTSKYSILMGPAGSGKTTILKIALGRLIYGHKDRPGIGIRKLPENGGLSVAIATFTGTAGSRIKDTLPSWLHPAVKTIHSLLEYKPASPESMVFVPTRHAENKLAIDVLIIDEVSMVGLNLWHNIIDALTHDTIVIIMGDINQLIPIGDSPFFPYILAHSQKPGSDWKLVELKKIHRQKGIGGQRILDSAHQILAGNVPQFDKIEPGKPWRVAFVPVSNKTEEAHSQIVRTVNGLRNLRGIDEDGNAEPEMLYVTHRDLILTAGNGDDQHKAGAAIQQNPINHSLARLITPNSDEHPVFIIDAGREEREYAVGDRVMCRQNESPDTVDRVTNGTIGTIIAIEENKMWNGDRSRFGSRAMIDKYQQERVSELMNPKLLENRQTNEMLEAFASLDTEDFDVATQTDVVTERQASHIITIRYRNGAKRVYTTASQIAKTQLAYAMTTQLAQGSQAPMVIIICHSAVARQLNREWFYTAITRASSRVLIFGTDLGLRTAISKQQIAGKTTQEKIDRYSRLFDKGDRLVKFCPD